MPRSTTGSSWGTARRIAFVAALCVIGAAAVPAGAGATLTSQTMSAAATPAAQDQTAFGGASLYLAEDETYTSGEIFMPVISQIVYHLDNDFAFDTTGLPQCPLASISAQTRENALAACPDSIVGSGTSQLEAQGQAGHIVLTGVIDVFNGVPAGGDPTIYLHESVYDTNLAEVLIETMPGTITTSTRGGDFGKQISIGPAITPGLAHTHLDFTLNNFQPAAGHFYVSARCNDADGVWEFAGDFTFTDASTLSASATQICATTPDAAGVVILNGPVSSTKTSKSFVFKVTNDGSAPLTLDLGADITANVTINGSPVGSVAPLTGTDTIRPGGSARYKLVWSYDSLVAPGDVATFNACVNAAGDIDDTNDCDSATAKPAT